MIKFENSILQKGGIDYSFFFYFYILFLKPFVEIVWCNPYSIVVKHYSQN